MKQLQSVAVEINTTKQPIKGTLWGNAELWGFSSTDPAFLKDCPSGELHSFNEYGLSAEWTAFRIYHKSIAAKVQELMKGN